MEKIKPTILIVLVAGIGDLVLASKSIRAIRNGYPDAEIHLLTNSEAVPIAQNYRYVDYVWPFPIREMRKNKICLIDVWKLLLKLRRRGFAIVANLFEVTTLRGAIKMGILFFLLNVRVRMGHNNKGFGFVLTDKVPSETFREKHRVDAMMNIALLAGGVPDEKDIEVFWDKRSEKKWEHIFFRKEGALQEIIVGVNPGGDRPNRRWSSKNFATIADRIIDEFSAKIIILGGPGEENISNNIQQRMKNDVVNLSGKLDLSDLVYIINRLDILITNDSGPMHIGAATGTPLVAIFGPGNPTTMRPYSPKKLYRMIYKGLDCQPCNDKKCTEPVCLNIITPEEVYEKCVELLNANKSMQFKR